MTIELTSRADAVGRPPAGRSGLRARRRLRAAAEDAAQLAGLHRIREVLTGAAGMVAAGWLQDAWFCYRDDAGREWRVTARTGSSAGAEPWTRACLVAAVIGAGGGLAATRTEPVQRALDVTWHALRAAPHEHVRWCPAPTVRAAHVQDLTRWNDDERRSQHEVQSLLHRARDITEDEISRAGSVLRVC